MVLSSDDFVPFGNSGDHLHHPHHCQQMSPFPNTPYEKPTHMTIPSSRPSHTAISKTV
jgi:hypothetical protein